MYLTNERVAKKAHTVILKRVNGISNMQNIMR